MCPGGPGGARRQALAASGLQDAALRFYWTGGRDGARMATALATVTPIPDDLETLRARGIRVVSLELGIDHAARARSPWLLGGVKSTSYAVHVAALAEARRRGADDAILLASDGMVLEGATSNVWWAMGDRVRTPGLDLGILAGVTRSHLLRLGAGPRLHGGGGWLAARRRARRRPRCSCRRRCARWSAPSTSMAGSVADGRPGPVAPRSRPRSAPRPPAAPDARAWAPLPRHALREPVEPEHRQVERRVPVHGQVGEDLADDARELEAVARAG